MPGLGRHTARRLGVAHIANYPGFAWHRSGNGTFVAVGNSGTVLTSPMASTGCSASGTSRQSRGSGIQCQLAEFHRGRRLQRSSFPTTKGASWGANNVDPSYNLLSVASKVGVGERWVVVGNPNKLLTTTHPAVPWSQSSGQAVLAQCAGHCRTNASGTFAFVVTGRAGQVATSTDGNTWQVLSCGFSDAIFLSFRYGRPGHIFWRPVSIRAIIS